MNKTFFSFDFDGIKVKFIFIRIRSSKSRMKGKAQYLLVGLTIKYDHLKTGMPFVYIHSCFDTAVFVEVQSEE